MKYRKLAAIGAAVALAATILGSPQAQAGQAGQAGQAWQAWQAGDGDGDRAAKASRKLDEVVFRNGSLTSANRVPGSNAVRPDAILSAVTVRHDIRGGLLQMTATLAGAPTDNGYGYSDVSISLGVGEYDALGRCSSSISGSNNAYIPAPEVSYGEQWSQSGNVISFTDQSDGYDYDPGYNCVVAKTSYDDDDYNDYTDTLQGTMTDDYGVPNLQTPTKKVKLVKKATSLIPIDITNVGTSSASVTVTGKGKGVKVTSTRIEKVSSTTPAIAWLPIKLKKKKAKKIKLKMTSVGHTNTAVVRAKAVRKPKAAKPGQYGGGVAEFTVLKGSVPRVSDFQGSISTACSGIPTQNLSFQIPLSLRIWPNGQVQGQVAVDDYVIEMQMVVKGKRAGQGYLRYQNAGVGCEGETPFNAQRLGA